MSKQKKESSECWGYFITRILFIEIGWMNDGVESCAVKCVASVQSRIERQVENAVSGQTYRLNGIRYS